MIRMVSVLIAVSAAALMLVGCTQAPPPAATQAPAKPAAPATAAPAAPTAASATAAPTKAAAPTAAPTAAAAAPPKVNWPEKGKSITYIVGFSAGGAADILARRVAPGLEKELGVPVQIVNKPGAETVLSLTELAKAKPDGYTIASLSLPSLAVNMLDPEMRVSLSRKDLQPVANVESHTNVMAVLAEGPYKTMKDVVDAAKAKPKGIKWAGSGQMSPASMVGYFLADVAGIQFSYIFFDSGAEVLAAVLGGHADLSAFNPSVATPQVKQGKLRALATSAQAQSPLLPGIKTLKEQGYDVVTSASTGIVAPAGTSKEIVDLLSGAVKRVLATPEIKKAIEDSGVEADYMDPTQLAANWDRAESDARKGLAIVRGPQK